MNNALKIYIALLVLIFIGIVFVESTRPKTIDWMPYYTVPKKSPYGLYVLNKEIDRLLGKQKVQRLDETPYEFFDSRFDYDSLVMNYTVKGTYLSIEDKSRVDAESIGEILSFVSRGNEAFISGNSISNILLDTLGLSSSSKYSFHDTVFTSLKYGDTTTYRFTKMNYLSYFDSIDLSRTEVLGQVKIYDSSRPLMNFLRVKFKAGYVYVHTLPVAFTNYSLLKEENRAYATSALSFIQDKHPIYWNSHDYQRHEKASTPMRVILSYSSLQWAWYFLLIGFLIYLIFNAKRKQRIIPIIKPLENTTIDFVKTISNMYYQDGNYKNILRKRITYFLSRLRSEYHIDTNQIDDKFVQKLSIKSGKSKSLIERIVRIVKLRKNNRYLSENDLVELNTLLEEFWKS